MAASILSIGARGAPARAASLSLGSAVTPRSSLPGVSRVASNASLASLGSAASMDGGKTPRTPKTPKTPTYFKASCAMSPAATSSFSAASIKLASQGYGAPTPPSAFGMESASLPNSSPPIASPATGPSVPQQQWRQKPEYPMLLGQQPPNEEDRRARAVRFCDGESLARSTRDAVLARLRQKQERKTWTEKKNLMSL
eukprot:TRINITY_DN77253_c0_g1_i1.p1 TRINITY_DN77253_c0_g1~~TRINITY_DN77253_c0_g1_i1.p1  ORF type:complete len:221 (-),score=33.13 TRINITY_DN77253_c0_g1_i1:130-723(-)